MYIYRVWGVVYGPYFSGGFLARRFFCCFGGAQPQVAASLLTDRLRSHSLTGPLLSREEYNSFTKDRAVARTRQPRRLLLSVIRQKVSPQKQAQRAPSDTPAPGYRDANSMRGYGAMRGVGSHGYSWSSFVSEDIAYRLGLSNGGISPQGIDNRAYGFPLRCLQEHPKGVLLAIRRRKAQLSRAERHRADASGTLQRKAQPSSAERHRDRRSHAPEPPPATGATSTGSVLPALAPRRGISVYRPAANPSRRKFGPSPTPLRPLCGLGDWAARCFASRN